MLIPSNSSIDALRAALDAPQGTLVIDHSRLIEAVRAAHPHTVTLVAEPGIMNLTCVPHTFELDVNPIYRAIARDFNREVFAGRKFVEWMIANRLVEIEEVTAGCCALYFSGADWRHVGTMIASGRAISQWGTFPIYEHDIGEVPASYGDQVRFFVKPSPKQAFADFLDYARDEGVSDQDIAAIIAEVEAERNAASGLK